MERIKTAVQRSSLLCLFAFTFLVSSVALGQDAPAVEPKAPDFAGLKQLQPDDTNVVVMGDVLPHIRRILGNADVQKMIKEGRFGKAIADDTGEEPDPAAWLKSVEDNAQHIPSEIIVAMPDKAMTQFSNLFTLTLQGFLAKAIKDDAGGEAIKDLPALQAEALATLQAIEMPRVTVFVRFRTPADVRLAMGAVRVQAGNMQQTMPDAVTVAAKRVTMNLKVGDHADEATVGGMLMQSGLVDDVNSETGKALVAAVMKLRMFVAVDMVDNGLKVSLSPDALPAATGVADKDLAPLWKGDGSTVMFLNWNLKPWHAAMADLGKYWGKWEKTVAGKDMIENDKQGMIASIRSMMDQAKTPGTHVAYRMWADQAFHVEALDDTDMGKANLHEAPWLTMIPAGTDAVAMNGGASFGEEFKQMMDQVDQVVARMASAPGMEEANVRMEKPLQELRATADKMPAAFGPTAASIVTSEGKLTKLTFAVAANEEKHTMTLQNVGIMEMASFAVAKDGAAAEKLIRDAADEIAQTIIAGADKDVKNPVVLREQDLGLGMKTWVMETAWLTDMAKPDDVALTIEGDLKPHFFVLNNVVVMSTSPRLSKAIIAAAKAGKAYELPAGPVLNYAHMTGKTPVAALTMVADIVGEATKSMAGTADAMDADKSKHAIEIIMGLAEFATMIDKAEGVTRLENGQNHSMFDLTFQAGHLIK